jgi:hypothetical protein
MLGECLRLGIVGKKWCTLKKINSNDKGMIEMSNNIEEMI